MKRLILFAAAVLTVAGCSAPRPRSVLLAPAPEIQAPDSFDVTFETGKGRFTVRAMRAWSPQGVDRFHYLVSIGFYDRNKFFRVIPDYVAQFGFHGDPAVNAIWNQQPLTDEQVKHPNLEGTVSFAKGGPDNRTTHLFVNLSDNRSALDTLGFAPIARVVNGMHVVRALFSGYGDGPPRGGGPDQSRIEREGNRYLERNFPRLDSIVRARIIR